MLSWEIGDLEPGEQGSVTFGVAVKDGLPSGTNIVNLAEVHFPSADEITPTNPVVNTVNTIVADPQTVSTVADTPLAITLTGRDAGSGSLTFQIDAKPANGSLSGAAPQLTYTPMAQFSGQDSFTFRVNSSQIDSGSAVVRIKVISDPSDSNPPTVVETDPSADTRNVHVSQSSISQDPAMYRPTIKATFSEPMDAATITTETFTISGLSGSVAYDQHMRTALFSPSTPLAYGTTYAASIDGVTD